MNRLNSAPYFCRSIQRLLGCSPRDVFIPTALEMIEFAAQFSSGEWGRLCENRGFLAVVDKDLMEAGAIAGALLKRSVFAFGIEK